MTHLNNVVVMGNATRDVETKEFNGNKVANFTVASNRAYKNKNTGEFDQETCFIDVSCWGYAAQKAEDQIKKGQPVLVSGRLKLDRWESENGTRQKHSIVADKVISLVKPEKTEESSTTNSPEQEFGDTLPF